MGNPEVLKLSEDFTLIFNSTLRVEYIFSTLVPTHLFQIASFKMNYHKL